MADVVVASCAEGQAALIVETDAQGRAVAVRCESTVPALLTISDGSNTWTVELGTGVRRVSIPAGRRFVLDTTEIAATLVAIG